MALPVIPDELVRLLRLGNAVAVLTGAGVSAASGIPTFHDPRNGVWSRVRPEEIATPEAFLRDPAKVWCWYMERRREMARVEPNPAHYALAIMETLVPDFTLITQNIDGLHQRAGSRNVVELHGNIARTTCWEESIPVGADEWLPGTPPRCPRCGGWVRPDVVWFGEALPQEPWSRAVAAAQGCALFFSVGTSSIVYPAASLPWVARNHGARIVEVNPASTPLTAAADFVLAGPADRVLPRLVEVVWGRA